MAVGEGAQLREEEGERAPVAEFEEGIPKHVVEEQRQVSGQDDFLSIHGGLFPAEQLDALGEKVHALLSTEGLGHEGTPAEGGQIAGEKAALPAHLHGLLVQVVHEFVDERQGDQLHLIGRYGELPHQDVTTGIDAAFGLRGQNGRARGKRVPGGGQGA